MCLTTDIMFLIAWLDKKYSIINETPSSWSIEEEWDKSTSSSIQTPTV